MQIKFLTVALATALTATLTGCGSDGDSNYNKQDVAPINFGDADSTEVKKLQTNVDELTNKLATSKKESAETVKKLEDRLQEALEAINKLKEDKGSPSTGGNTPETVPGEDRQPETEQPTNTEGSNPTNTEGSNPTNTEGSNPTNTDTAQPTKPDTAQPTKPVDVDKDPVHNPGLASAVEDVAAVDLTVVQNYVRGEGANFDRKLNKNPKDTGNATVVGSETLENKVLSNIIIARPQVERGVAQVFAGEGPNDASTFSFTIDGLKLNSGHENSLQEKNISIVNYNSNADTANSQANGENATTSIFTEDALKDVIEGATIELGDSKKVADRPYVLDRGYVGATLGDSLHKLYASAEDNNITTDNNAKGKLDKIGLSAYKSGLVRTLSIGQANDSETPEYLKDTTKSETRPVFIIRGQEDQTIKVKKDGKVEVVHATGSETIVDKDEARIFGTLSQSADGYRLKENSKNTLGDTPSEVWDSVSGKFKVNPNYSASVTKYSLSKGTPNSYQLTAASANADRAAIKKIESEKFSNGGKNNALFRAGLTAKPIHLNYVQYGRVTTKADQKTINQLKRELDGGAIVVQNELGAKHRYEDGKAFKPEKNEMLDTYFARGLQETKDMPKQGTVEYLGHALTYGLDNSYHKDDAYVSNSIVGVQREGVGNFVRATADFAKGTVEGNIYNVWTTVGGNNDANLGSKVEEDKLVGFKGDITAEHNSVLGESWLEYGNKDKGSFKGAFFGKGAAELGGSVNSVQSGYAKASWGGVFGAKAVTPQKVDDTDLSAHIENK